jgi:hypothetical protein
MERNLEVLFLFLMDLDVADRIVIVILLSPHNCYTFTRQRYETTQLLQGPETKHLVLGVRGIRVLSRMRCLQL